MANAIVALGGLAVAVGLPAYYIHIKRRAASSLDGLLAERFAQCPCPVPEVPTNVGPVRFYAAYNDTAGSGLVLVLGNWVRSRTAFNRVAGLFKPAGSPVWLERVQNQPDLLLATIVAGGALVVWKELPTKPSVLEHMESVRSHPGMRE
jgi:hypothetical protein